MAGFSVILQVEYHAALFAFGEFYCYAVIFGLRRVIFATQAFWANRISLKS